MRLKLIGIAVIVAVSLIAFGCSGPMSPVDHLRQRGEGQAKVSSKQNWLKLYEYQSPQYRDICKSGDYAVQLATAWLLFMGLFGIEADATVESRVTNVTVQGLEGRVFGEMLVDGKVVEFGEAGDGGRWVFVDGEWWSEADDWADGCPGLDFGG